MKNRVVIGGRYQYAPLECLKENNRYSQFRAYDKVTKKDLILQIHKIDDPFYEKLRDIKHAFIQGVYDIVPLEEEGLTAIFFQSGKLCTLGDAIKRNIFIQEGDAMVLLKYMVLGLKALHEKMIVSGRICMDNIFLCNLSLVRLGWNLTDGQIPIKSQSPEVLREERPTYASDIFSLGTILYKMLFGCDPFEGQSEENLLSQIKSKRLKTIPSVSPFDICLTKDAYYLLTSMLDYYPENRPSLESILETKLLSFYVQTEMQSYVKPKGAIIPEPFMKKYLVIRASKTIIRYDDYYEEAVYLALNIKEQQFMTLYCPDVKSSQAEGRKVQSYLQKLRAIKEGYVEENSNFLCRIDDYERFRRQPIFVTEYCNQGDLYSYLEKRKIRKGWLNEKQINILMYLIAFGYKQMRDLGVTSIHTVNSQRIMIKNKNIKLRQPGLITPYLQRKLAMSRLIDYFAPQLKERTDFVELDKSDIWSYGILYYYLIARRIPVITQENPTIDIQSLDTHRKNRNLIGKCLDQNVKRRINLQQVKIEGADQSLLEEMLQEEKQNKVKEQEEFDDSEEDGNERKYQQKNVMFKSKKQKWCKHYNKIIAQSHTSNCRIWIKILIAWLLVWAVFFGSFFVNGGVGMLKTNHYRRIQMDVPKNYGTTLYTMTILSTDGANIESQYEKYSYEQFINDLNCMQDTRASDAEADVYEYINGAGHSVQCLFGFIFGILFCIVYAISTHKLDLPTLLVKRKKTKENKGLYLHILIIFILSALLFCFFYIFALQYIIQMTPCLGLQNLAYPAFTSVQTLLKGNIGLYFAQIFTTVILWSVLMFIYIFISLLSKKVHAKIYEWKAIIPTLSIMLVYTVICRIGFGGPLPLQPTWSYNMNLDITLTYYGFFGFFPQMFYLILFAMQRLVDLIFWVFLRLGMEPDEEEDIKGVEIKAKFEASEDYEKAKKKQSSINIVDNDFEIFD